MNKWQAVSSSIKTCKLMVNSQYKYTKENNRTLNSYLVSSSINYLSCDLLYSMFWRVFKIYRQPMYPGCKHNVCQRVHDLPLYIVPLLCSVRYPQKRIVFHTIITLIRQRSRHTIRDMDEYLVVEKRFVLDTNDRLKLMYIDVWFDLIFVRSAQAMTFNHFYFYSMSVSNVDQTLF